MTNERAMTINTMDISAYTESQELLSELRIFIAGASKSVKTNPPDLARTALSLLNTLPAARDAVLEYFCTLFHFTVTKHLSSLYKRDEEKSEEEPDDSQVFILEIQEVLYNFITLSPEAWAPIISVWSLDLLGQISVCNASAHMNLSLNDRLQLWIGCQPTRTLIEINTQCLQCLMHSSTDACISALLDKSVQYSPHFDWVVAHVGSCFPQTVINKVLHCGLKDFCVNEQASKTPKLNSVIGILAHLANTHFNDIKTALCHLFLWSLETNIDKDGNKDKNITMQRIATVPFLLQICSSAHILLKALSDNALQSLNVNVIMQLSSLATSWWCYFEGGRKELLELVVRLILNLENGINQVIDLLLDTATLNNPDTPAVIQTGQELVELLLSEMDLCLRTSDSIPPLIRSLPINLTPLLDILSTSNEMKLTYGTSLFVTLGKYNSLLLSSGISYLLICATDEIHTTSLLEMITSLNDVKFFGDAMLLALQDIDSEIHSTLILCRNITQMLRWEQKFNNVRKPVLHGLMDNLEKVIQQLRVYYYDFSISSVLVTLIYDLLMIGQRQLLVYEVVALTEVSVKYLFSCIIAKTDNSKKLKHCQIANKLLHKLCTSCPTVARMLALRLIAETALNPPVSPIFGAIVKPDASMPLGTEHCLLEENITQGHLLMVAQSSMSVLHAGVIGGGLRKTIIQSNLSDDQIDINIQHLITAIRWCCITETNQVVLEAAIDLALLLVHMISPDVMFNGLPWPDEDFCKVTVERDLCIRHTFDSTPLIWALLKFISLQRPALCYCSVLLRGVMATVICQWSSASQGRHVSGSNAELIVTTSRLLDLMALGQLLPAPLNSIQDVIPNLSAQQVLVILRECVWNYMKDHVPAPALFIRNANGSMWRDPSLSVPPKQYTETLRIVMLGNIEKFGSLYNKFFTNVGKETD